MGSHQANGYNLFSCPLAQYLPSQKIKKNQSLVPRTPQRPGTYYPQLRASGNPKHKCILMLIYSAGLRLGELTRLRLDDLEPEAGRIFVYGGKGKKDRIPLPPTCWKRAWSCAIYKTSSDMKAAR